MIRLKTNEEIAGIRKSCKLLTNILDEVCNEVKAGVTTNYLNKCAENLIKDAGGEPAFSKYGGFPTALCTSVNEVVIHGVPSDVQLKNGDIIGLDLGISLSGFFSDKAITVCVGEVDGSVKKLLIDTEKSLMLGISAITEGGRIKDIGRAISKYLNPLGYGVVHQYCGHGVGLAVHEDPMISNDYPSSGPNPRVKRGMVLAIEPMVNMGVPEVYIDKKDGWSVYTKDKKVSSHFEHTVAIMDEGVEILTSR